VPGEVSARVKNPSAEQLLPATEGLLGPVTRGAGGPFALSSEEIGG